jgi:tRNA (guanine-N7-)-methyltransferase
MAVRPEDFIITRKRKKYKFALFANSPLCFEFDEWSDAAFTPDVVELGAGTGLFAVELAKRHPEKRFVAVDVKAARLQKGARLAESEGLTNIRFLRARADQLVQIFEPNTLTDIWVTFPDPHPKKRSAGRRLTHPTFLTQYAALLAPHGSFNLKHDNELFFAWSLEQLVHEKWHITELSFDLHDSEQVDDYKILTTYEQRWLDEGLKTHFVRAEKCQ